MPKPSVNKQKKEEIQHMLNSRSSRSRTRKRPTRSKLQPVFIGIGALVAVGLFAILFSSTLLDNQFRNIVEQPTADVIQEDYTEIKATAETDQGVETYTASDTAILERFETMINTIEAVDLDANELMFDITFLLYGENQQLVETIRYNSENVLLIGDQTYTVDQQLIDELIASFFTEDYMEEENPPEENEEPVTEPDDEENIDEEDEPENEQSQQPKSMEEVAQETMEALAERDMDTLANYVHKERGLLLSPYVHIESEALRFNQDEVANLLNADQVYHWGTYDGSGEPIDLTASEYFDSFVKAEALLNPDQLTINEIQNRGNLINNIEETFPNASWVEYYNEGSEEYGGMDWNSLYLIYEKENDVWKLVAVVNDQWTI